MSNTAIKLKKSGVTGNTPSGLANGELALNFADGKLYYKNSLGGTSYISNQFSFDTINSNNSLILAGSGSDTLSFVAGNSITISTNTDTKTITINASIAGGSDPGPAFTRANAAFITANNALAKSGGTVTGNVTLSTTATMIIQNTRPTTSNSTGALIIDGGLAVKGNTWVSGIFTVDGDFSVGNQTTSGNVINNGVVTFTQPTSFTNTNPSTSNTTGAIIVTGGAGIQGNVYAGAIRVQNNTPTTSNSTGALIVQGGTAVKGNLWVGGVFTVDGDFQVGNQNTSGNVYNTGIVTFSQPTYFTNTNPSTSNTTGAVIISGGVGIKGNVYAGAIRVQNTTTSVSNSTGALTVAGGVGIAGNLYVGGVFTVDGDFQVGNQNTSGNVYNTGNVTFTQITQFTSNAVSTSNSTGAVIVAGGVGIKGNVHTGDIRITGSTSNGITFVDGTKQYTANVGLSIATSAEVTATSAFNHANAAFQASNTSIISGGSGSAISFAVDRFTANGATTTFNLSVSPTSNTNTTVVVDGIVQHKNTYTVSGGIITFDSTFENGANIEVTSTTLSTTSFINRTFVGDGSTNNFTISYNTTANSILVFGNGITQNPVSDYTVSGNNLIFVSPPTNGTIIQVRELAPVVNVTYTIDTTVANVAFDTANAAYTHANAAYNQANTGGSDSWVRTQANNAYDTANSAGLYSNGAFTSANTADGKATSASLYANGAFTKANNTLSLTGGIIAGNVTANSFIANTSVYSPVYYSPSGASNLILSDIGLVAIAVAGQTYQFGASGIESNKGIYGGSYGGNRLSLDNETKLVSNRYDTVKIATGTDGTDYSTWTFANNQFVFPDNTYQNTAFQGVAIDQTSRNIANSASLYANGAFAAANSGSSSSFAFDQANAAFAQANAAYAQANTGGGSTTDSWARIQANAAYDTANSASLYANGAFTSANTADDKATSAGLYANGAFTSANTVEGKVASASLYANGAFIAANTADGKATSAGLYANGAFIKANSANVLAQASFDTANSAAVFANGAFTTANLKFNSTGGTISGDVNITGNLSITGNTFSTSATQIVANDTLFIMGTGNYSGDVLDIGFAAHYNNGTNAHTGLIRDAGTKEWQLFEEYTPEIGGNNNVIITDGSFKIATLNANLKSTSITVKGIDLLPYVNGAFDVANSSSIYANGAFSASNSASSLANAAFTQANSNYTSAVTKLNVTNSGASSYLIDQYTGNNPPIYVSAGETISFNLDVSGHPFLIRDASGGTNTSDGLTHISTTGVISTGSGAQGKESGILFWKVPFSLVGNTYVYQCQYHSGMVGDIVIQQPVSFVASNTILAFNQANSAYTQANTATTNAAAADSKAVVSGSYANAAFAQANTADGKATSAGLYANAAFAAANSGSSSAFAFGQANAAFGASNSASLYANSAFITANASYNSQNVTSSFANSAFAHANAAYAQANTGGSSTDSWAREQANASFGAANSASLYANGAFAAANSGGSSTDSYARDTANAAFIQANAAFTQANTGGSTTDSFARVQANAAFDSSNTVGVYANAAFSAANTKFNSSGGTISGDVTISGNLIIVGVNVYANTETVLIKDNIITLNAAISQSGAPVANAGIEIDRGTSANASLIWSEVDDKWVFSSDSTTYYEIAAADKLNSSFDTANLAYAQANAAFSQANTGGGGSTTDTYARNTANAAFIQANSAFSQANTGGTSLSKAIALSIVFGF